MFPPKMETDERDSSGGVLLKCFKSFFSTRYSKLFSSPKGKIKTRTKNTTSQTDHTLILKILFFRLIFVVQLPTKKKFNNLIMGKLVIVLLALAFAAALAHGRLVAIGDIHGDLAQYHAILQLAGLTDKANHWNAAKGTTLVQVGDLLDRGPDDEEILLYSKRLQEEAKAAGSDFVLLVGNHEILNLQGFFRYVHPKSMESTGSKAERLERFSSAGDLGSFIRTFKLVHSQMGTVFVHAGLSIDYAQYGLDKLNAISSAALDANDFNNAIFGATGPVWTRTLINEASHGRCSMVKKSLDSLGLQRMVVGHTPQRAGNLETYCDDSLIAIDVGISKYMYGNMAALELSMNEAGEMEMREITGRYMEADDAAAAATPSGLEEALKDQNVLQEIMEITEEANKKAAKDGAAEDRADL